MSFRPNSSWEKSTNVARAMLPQKLRVPSRRARVRSTRWWYSQRRPSPMSARIERRGAGWPSRPRRGGGRKEPTSVAMRAAETKNEAASAQNGSDSVAANRSPPTGGPTKLLADDLGGVLAAVGQLQQRRRHDRRQHRLGGVVEQRLGHAEGEGHQVQRPDLGRAGGGGDGDDADQHAARHVRPHHQRPPVGAVDDGPGDEGEEQPRQAGRRGQAGHQPGVAGQRGGQQRQGGEVDAVAEVGDGAGGPQPPVGRAQAGRLGGRVLAQASPS